MNTLNNVIIKNCTNTLSERTSNHDMISGLLFDGDATSEGLKHNTVFQLRTIDDAERLGITDKYDGNGQSAYYQIEQFFRINPLGELYIMAVKGTAYKDVVSTAHTMQVKTKGQIRQMAIIFSGNASFDDTRLAIDEAQLQANAGFDMHMPFEILLEGKGVDKIYSNDSNELDDLADFDAKNVSVVIAMDIDVAKQYSNTAAVGMTLGAVSYAKVSENIVWTEQFNLQGKGFVTPGLVGGKIASQEELNVLNQRRYIFAREHIGLSGLYFNDSHTAVSGTSEFAYLEHNRTTNKAVRLLYNALLPKLNSKIIIDTSGTLALSIIKGLEALCLKALRKMVSHKEISTYDIFIDPSQNIIATSELKIKVEVVPIGTARKIVTDIIFKNPFGLKDLKVLQNN